MAGMQVAGHRDVLLRDARLPVGRLRHHVGGAIQQGILLHGWILHDQHLKGAHDRAITHP